MRLIAGAVDSSPQLCHQVRHRRRLALTTPKLFPSSKNIFEDLLTTLICRPMSQDLDEHFLLDERQLIRFFEDTSKRGGL